MLVADFGLGGFEIAGRELNVVESGLLIADIDFRRR